MLDIQQSKIIKQLPEYLRQEKQNVQDAKEYLELLEPNAVNITAQFIESIYEQLDQDKFNNWTEFEKYVTEFKLDEVFAGLEDKFYSISQPELLKGFFTFKGTEIDIQYLMKIAGYSMRLFGAEYYLQEKSVYDLILYREPDLFKKLLDTKTKEEVDTYFESLYNNTLKVVSNQTAIKVNNTEPIKVVNVDNSKSIHDILLDLGYTEDEITDDLENKLSSLYLLYQNSFTKDYTKINCTLTSEIYIDLDSEKYDGVRVRELHRQIRDLIKSRISYCIYLREIIVYLETKTIYNTKEKTATNENLIFTRETEDDLNSYAVQTFPFERLKVNNTEPIKADGRAVWSGVIRFPFWDIFNSQITRNVSDCSYFIRDKSYTLKVDNLNPVKVYATFKDNSQCNLKVQGQSANVFYKGYYKRVTQEGVVNNTEPIKVQGRLIQLGEVFNLDDTTQYAVAVGKYAGYRVNNTEPLKIKGQFLQTILDQDYLQVNYTNTEDIFRPAQKSDIFVKRTTYDSLSNHLYVNNTEPIKADGRAVKGLNANLENVEDIFQITQNKQVDDTFTRNRIRLYNRKVDNQQPLIIGYEVEPTIQVEGSRPVYFPQGYKYDVTNANPEKVDNQQPRRVEGRSIKLGEIYEYNPNEEYASFEQFKVNNLTPKKVKNVYQDFVDELYVFIYIERNTNEYSGIKVGDKVLLQDKHNIVVNMQITNDKIKLQGRI